MIKKIINDILNKLNDDTPIKKNIFTSDIMALNDVLENMLKNVKESEHTLLFRYNEDQRLAQIEEKLEKFKDKPLIGIQEGVKLCEDKIRNFLEYYHIGFCHDLKLNSYGTLEITIACLITNHHAFHDKDVSNQMKYEKQLEILKDFGLDISKNPQSKEDVYLLGTENNINLLNKLLSSFGCKLINFEILGERNDMCIINRISFRIFPSDLLKTNFLFPEIEFIVSDELNPDETSSLVANLKEFYSSYCTYKQMDNLKNTCGNIMLSLFSQICKTLDIETSITTQYDNQYKVIREKNKLIREKEIELGNLISGDIIKESMKVLYAKLNQIGYKEFNFRCSELFISSHNIDVTFHMYRQNYCFDDNIIRISEEEFKKRFDSIGTLNDESLNMLSTEKNLNKLNEIVITHIPTGFISDIKIQNHWSIQKFYIDSFTISISNVSDLF